MTDNIRTVRINEIKRLVKIRPFDNSDLRPEVRQWIDENVKGGWHWDTANVINDDNIFGKTVAFFTFEDASEAMLFKLTWA